MAVSTKTAGQSPRDPKKEAEDAGNKRINGDHKTEAPFVSAGQASDIRLYGEGHDHLGGKTLTEADLPK